MAGWRAPPRKILSKAPDLGALESNFRWLKLQARRGRFSISGTKNPKPFNGAGISLTEYPRLTVAVEVYSILSRFLARLGFMFFKRLLIGKQAKRGRLRQLQRTRRFETEASIV